MPDQSPGQSSGENVQVTQTQSRVADLTQQVPQQTIVAESFDVPPPPVSQRPTTSISQAPRPIPIVSEEIVPFQSQIIPSSGEQQVPIVPAQSFGNQEVLPVQANSQTSSSQPPVAQAPEISNSSAVSDGGQKKGFKPLSFKYLLFGFGALVILGGIAFAAKTFLFAPEKPEKIILTFWGFEDKSVMDNVIREYEAKNPQVKINYQKQAREDYRERLVNNLAKNAGPDIFTFHNTWLSMLSAQLGTAPSVVFDNSGFANAFYPTASRDLVRGNSVYGVPLSIDGLGLYINETIFNETQKLIPNNWNDLVQIAHELTQKDEEGRILRSGVALGRTENVDQWEDILSLMLLQNKADLANPQGDLAADPVLFFVSFAGEEKVWDDTLPSSTQAFAKGLVAMYLGSSSRAEEIKKQNPNLSFRVAPVPQLPKNAPDDPDVNYASYQALGVWGKSKNNEEAWKFLRFLSEKSSLEKLYAAVSAARGYGFPYPRPEMAQFLENDPLIGAYTRQGSTAKSSFLASGTFDGTTGINSRLSVIWKNMVDSLVKEERGIDILLPLVAQEVQKIMSVYSGQQ